MFRSPLPRLCGPLACLLLFAARPVSADSTVTLNAYQPQQVVVGFGASDAWLAWAIYNYYTPTDREKILDLLFSQKTGAGLSMVRNRIPPYLEPSPGVFDWTQADTYSMLLDQEAQQRGVETIWATPWTPPAWMKTNNDVNNGGGLDPAHYQDYANYLAAYIGHCQHAGIPLYEFSLQNEPDINAPYESCLWNGQQFHDFLLNNLIPTFQRHQIGARPVMPENSGWSDWEAAQTLADPRTANFVDAVATHNYDQGNPYPFNDAIARGKQTWETEVSNLSYEDPTMADGLVWANRVHHSFVDARANAWHYWWLVDFDDNVGQALVSGSASGTYTVNKRLWTIGNFSRFIRPGFHVATVSSSNPESGVLVSGYVRVGTGETVVVAINNNTSPTNLTVNVPGNSTSLEAAWRTSALEDLVKLKDIPVTGGSFTASLAAQSVTTFTGKVAPSHLNPPIQVAAGQGVQAPFVADTNFFGGNPYTSSNPVDTSGVVNPAPAALYQSQRWGNFQYEFSGLHQFQTYTVRLHFAETYWTQPGQRLFDVLANNRTVLTDYDVLAAAGGQNKAVVVTFPVVADRFGNILLAFTQGSADNPMVSGIEVLSPG